MKITKRTNSKKQSGAAVAAHTKIPAHRLLRRRQTENARIIKSALSTAAAAPNVSKINYI